MDTVNCRRAEGPDDLSVCLAIRHAVFVVGQQVPVELEQDGREHNCRHYLVFDGDVAVGTARVMPLDGAFKFQRVAVLDAYRARGVGTKLMAFMMDDIAQGDIEGRQSFVLSSQVSAIAFYERLGFEACSEVFMDAGIQHRDMRRPI